MKYEAMKAEIIRVQSEDVLTLSVGNGDITKKSASWDSLGFVDPATGNKV